MAALVLGTVGLVAIILFAARELWCHWYYPVRGRLYLRWRQPDLAAAAWESYLSTWTLCGSGRKLSARFSLSQCYWALGRLDDAVAQCETIVARRGTSALGHLARQLRADCLDRLGRPEAAAEARPAAAPAASARDQDRYAKSLEVERLESSGDWFAALTLLNSLAEDTLAAHLLDEHLLLRLRLAGLRLRLGLFAEAMTTAEGLLARPGLSSDAEHDAHQVAARAYLALGRFDQAERDARAAFRIANLAGDTERLADDCLHLGELAMHRGDFVEAMRQLQRVRECHGRGLWMAPLGEADLLRLWGRDDEAASALDVAERRVPPAATDHESPAMLVARFRAELLLDRDPAAAAAALGPFLATQVIDPRLAAGHAASCGLALTAAGRHAEAEPHWAAVAAGRERFAHDRLLLAALDLAEGRRAFLAGDAPAAVTRFSDALDRSPLPIWRSIIGHRLGRAHEAAGDRSAALEAYRAAAALGHPTAAQRAATARLAELAR